MDINGKIKCKLKNRPILANSSIFVLSIFRVALIVISVILAYQIADGIASGCMQNLFGVRYSTLDRERTAIYGSIKCFLPSVFFILLSILLAKSGKGLDDMGLLIHFKGWHIIAFLLCVPVFFFLSYLVEYVQHEFYFHNPGEYLRGHIGGGGHYMAEHGRDGNGYDGGFIYYSVICAPIGEEMIFRGGLYGRLRRIVPGKGFIPIAIIITSVCFAGIHHEFKLALSAFLFSICLCILRECTGNIYGGIVIHMLGNFQTFL